MIWTDSFLADVATLTTEEIGAFTMLRVAAWRAKDGRLPDDDRHLARVCRASPRVWARLRPVLAKLWVVEDGFWSNDGLDHERKRATAVSQTRSTAAHAKHRKTNKTADAYAPRLHMHLDIEEDKTLESLTSETPTRPPSEPELPLEPSAPAIPASKPKASKPAYPPQFEQLWAAYPLRKQDRDSKVDVFNRWKTETKGQDHEAIIAAARAFARANGQDDYRIGLKSWLRNRAWLSGPVLVTNGQPVRASPLTGAEFNRAERAHREKVEDQVEAKGHARWSPEWEQEVAVLMMEWVNEQRRSA